MKEYLIFADNSVFWAVVILPFIPISLPFSLKYLIIKQYMACLVYWGYVFCFMYKAALIYFYQYGSFWWLLLTFIFIYFWYHLSNQYKNLVEFYQRNITPFESNNENRPS